MAYNDIDDMSVTSDVERDISSGIEHATSLKDSVDTAKDTIDFAKNVKANHDAKKAEKQADKFGESKDAADKGKEAIKDTAENSKDATKEALKEAGKETAKRGAEAAADTAAASTEIGLVSVAAKKAVMGAANKLGETIGVDGKTVIIAILSIPIIIIMLLWLILMSFWKGTLGAFPINTNEAQYDVYNEEEGEGKKSEKHGFFSWFFEKDAEVTEEEDVGEYDDEKVITEGTQKELEVFRKAYEKCREIAKIKMGWKMAWHPTWDYELSWESFENEIEHIDEGINYAELISVVSFSPLYNSQNCQFNKLKRLFLPSVSNTNLNYLYCMKVEEATGMKTIFDYDETTGERIGQHEEERTYGKVTIRHYDLLRLFELIEVDPNDYNSEWQDSLNCDLIDTFENHLRTVDHYSDFGSTERTPWNYHLFDEELDNGFDYTEPPTTSDTDADNLDEIDDMLDSINDLELSEDAKEKIKDIIRLAYQKTREDTSYSMGSDRDPSKNIFDCSSFITYIFKASGVNLSGGTSAGICESQVNLGKQVATSYNPDVMQPGDLVFYRRSYDWCANRYKQIGHIALYIGDGQVIDIGGDDGVRVKKVGNNVVSVTRPMAGK